MMWPRFTFVIQQNIESVRLVDPQKIGTIDVQPHYVSLRLRDVHSVVNMSCCRFNSGNILTMQIVQSVRSFLLQITRRYAEFSAAIVSLNESFPDEKVCII